MPRFGPQKNSMRNRIMRYRRMMHRAEMQRLWEAGRSEVEE